MKKIPLAWINERFKMKLGNWLWCVTTFLTFSTPHVTTSTQPKDLENWDLEILSPSQPVLMRSHLKLRENSI